jgi:hexokinase
MLDPQVASRVSVGIVKHSRIVGAAMVAMMAGKTSEYQSQEDDYCL